MTCSVEQVQHNLTFPSDRSLLTFLRYPTNHQLMKRQYNLQFGSASQHYIPSDNVHASNC